MDLRACGYEKSKLLNKLNIILYVSGLCFFTSLSQIQNKGNAFKVLFCTYFITTINYYTVIFEIIFFKAVR